MQSNSKAEIYACYIVFNGARTLSLSLRSIVSYVDKVIIVDGAFKEYPHKHPQSTDGTKQIAEELCGDKLIWVDCPQENGKYVPWIGQVAKRNAYLELVPHHAWFYVMDDDVVLAGDIERAFQVLRENTLEMGCVLVNMINLFPILRRETNYSKLYYGVPTGRDIADRREHWKELLKDNSFPTSISMKKWDARLWWFGRRNVVSCIHRKHKGMQYKKHHSTIYTAGNKLMCFPTRASTPILPHILAVNMKFLSSREELINAMRFKIKRRKQYDAGGEP